MKIRLDFITNSSSSSFIISKRDITLEQYKLAKEVGWDRDWSVSESKGIVTFETFMDNFDMYSYLQSIGVKESPPEEDEWRDY